ncbi:hypothetical protein [Alteromonas lipotrueae]|uniref:hypothetical protein n=1 Tax=Alteromonas lipotrueae TaxID=2803814 RepID=UPI001C452D7B|nr:hypothetical protein [Alteromonas lipotrueae]
MTVSNLFAEGRAKKYFVVLTLFAFIAIGALFYGINGRISNQLESCEIGFLYRNDIFQQVEAELERKDFKGVENYIAFKSLSETGLKYLLLTSSRGEFFSIMYEAPGKLQTMSLSESDGQYFFDSIGNVDFDKVAQFEGAEQFSSSCYFVKSKIGNAERLVSFINPNVTEINGESAIELVSIFHDFLRNNYENKVVSAIPENPPEPMTSEKIEELTSQQKGDVFSELRPIVN